MKKQHPNYRLVKSHRNYTVEEIAVLFAVHKNTVRIWIRGGLRIIDEKRPILILGQELIGFLQMRRGSKKQPCQRGQMYCIRCRHPKFPTAGTVDFQPITDKLRKLTAICPDCKSYIYRMVNMAGFGEFYEKMDVTFSQALPHIREIIQPTLNSDLRGDV